LSNERGSMITLFFKFFNIEGFKKVLKCFRLPRFTYLKGITLKMSTRIENSPISTK
jgi:hypothetical protein